MSVVFIPFYFENLQTCVVRKLAKGSLAEINTLYLSQFVIYDCVFIYTYFFNIYKTTPRFF